MIEDFGPRLRRAVAVCKEEGLEAEVFDLEQRSLVVYATQSEWLGDVGAAIAAFKGQYSSRIPDEAKGLFDQCLGEIAKVWPKFAP